MHFFSYLCAPKVLSIVMKNPKLIVDPRQLIEVPKFVNIDGHIQELYKISCNFPIDVRLILDSKDDVPYEFLMQITQSAKNSVKMSLHLQSNNLKIGLFRVDYVGTHKNPEEVTKDVPSNFLPYRGQIIRGSHIHYYVQGYNQLEWAIPIEMTDYSCKKITEFQESIVEAIECFAETIHLNTKLNFERALL